MKTTRAEWYEVMAGLQGQRLAVYDELLRGIEPRAAAAGGATEEALRWLNYHRLAWRSDEGWRARNVVGARRLWELEGPLLEAAKMQPVPGFSVPSAGVQIPELAGRRAGAAFGQQGQFLDLEGYFFRKP